MPISAKTDGMNDNFTIIAFYRFVHLSDFQQLKAPLFEFMIQEGILGTILLAQEGINGTVSGTPQAIEKLIARFNDDSRFSNLEYKFSTHHEQPFKKTKVKLKKEIISFGKPLSAEQTVGTYVNAEEWNQLLDDKDVVVIDTRNNYEVELGTFPGAINPDTESFRGLVEFTEKELAAHKDAKVAMFCTGGIRCEKFSSYLLEKGFKNVYHLQGGILKYLANVPESENKWQGTCYVFDDRRFLK